MVWFVVAGCVFVSNLAMAHLSHRNDNGKRENRTFGVELANCVNYNYSDSSMGTSSRSTITSSPKTINLSDGDLQENRIMNRSLSSTTNKRPHDEDCPIQSRASKKRKPILDQVDTSTRNVEVPNKYLQKYGSLTESISSCNASKLKVKIIQDLNENLDTNNPTLCNQIELLPSTSSNTKAPLRGKESTSADISHPVVSKSNTLSRKSKNNAEKLTTAELLVTLNSASHEEQLDWLTSPNPLKSFNYYCLLIQERLKALQEVWTENDCLESEITKIKAENAELESLCNQISTLQKMLQATQPNEQD